MKWGLEVIKGRKPDFLQISWKIRHKKQLRTSPHRPYEDGMSIDVPRDATRALVIFYVPAKERNAWVSLGQCVLDTNSDAVSEHVARETQIDVYSQKKAEPLVLRVTPSDSYASEVSRTDTLINTFYTSRTSNGPAEEPFQRFSVVCYGHLVPMSVYLEWGFAEGPSDEQLAQIAEFCAMMQGRSISEFLGMPEESKMMILARFCRFIASLVKYREDRAIRGGDLVPCNDYTNPYLWTGDDCEGMAKICGDTYYWLVSSRSARLVVLREYAKKFRFSVIISRIVSSKSKYAQHCTAVLLPVDPSDTRPGLLVEGTVPTCGLVTDSGNQVVNCHMERPLVRLGDTLNNWYGESLCAWDMDEGGLFSNPKFFCRADGTVGVPLADVLEKPSACKFLDPSDTFSTEIIEEARSRVRDSPYIELEEHLVLGKLRPTNIPSPTSVFSSRKPSASSFFTASLGGGATVYFSVK